MKLSGSENGLLRWQGRLAIACAALLWSLSGFFTRILRVDTIWHLNDPILSPGQITFYRSLFAGLVLIPLVPWKKVELKPTMGMMVFTFAVMNILFVSAMALGSAANAILLQNMAPFYVFLISVFIFKQPLERGNLISLIIGMGGILLIIFGNGIGNNWEVTAMGLGSGLTYALVILFLKMLRSHSPIWLIMQNQLGSAFLLLLAMIVLNGVSLTGHWLTEVSFQQLICLMVFGVIQMGTPYCLFAYGLRFVSPAEAGMITLLEPLLNPLWAFLISPETDTPPGTTLIGGALILTGLIYRYLPQHLPKRIPEPKSTSENLPE